MSDEPPHKPSDAVTIERAARLTNEAMWVVALQRRRLRTTEPEDHSFPGRLWADWQFFIVALIRLRAAAKIACAVPSARDETARALAAFDEGLPIRRMRDVGEHIDDYAVGRGKHPDVERRALEVGSFDATTLRWHITPEELNADTALVHAEALCDVIRRIERRLLA
jgi:hypothetical protein